MESHKHNDQSLSTWWQELQGLATSSGSGEIPQAVLLNPYIHLDPGSVWPLHCKHDPLLSNISNDMQSISCLNYLQEKVLWLSQHLSGILTTTHNHQIYLQFVDFYRWNWLEESLGPDSQPGLLISISKYAITILWRGQKVCWCAWGNLWDCPKLPSEEHQD